MRRALAAAVAAVLALAAPAAAAPQLVAVGDFDVPVHVAAPPSDPDLYVVEQRGRVYVIDRGTTHLFLNTEATTNYDGEQGLLSIAFHPQYAANGLFYVFEAVDDGDADSDVLAVVEYRRDPADPLRALPESRRVAMAIPHEEYANHNGGQLAFGPDGLLWVSVGDGGEQGDPPSPESPAGDARNLASPLGKLLRFNPTQPQPADYGIAHFGLRNPWRFSFDRATGDLVVGDVGGSIAEEITFVEAAAAAGRVDFGWRCVEGDYPHSARCPIPDGARAPSVVLRHDDPNGYASVIAGFVVRDPQVPSLAGRFVYADLAHERIRAATLPAAADDGDTALAVATPLSFGEDACGRIYVTEAGGRVARIEEQQPSLCAPAGAPPEPPAEPGPATPATDARACGIGVRGRRQRLHKRLRLRVASDEACTLRVAARVRGVARFRARTVTVQASAARRVRLAIKPRARRRLARALRRRGPLRVRITVRSTDAAGNTSTAAARIRLRAPRRRS